MKRQYSTYRKALQVNFATHEPVGFLSRRQPPDPDRTNATGANATRASAMCTDMMKATNFWIPL